MMDQSQVAETGPTDTSMSWLWTMGLLGVYVLLTFLTGFVLATVIYILAMRFLGIRKVGKRIGIVDLAVSVGLGILIALIGYFLRIPFPSGLLWQSLRF